MTVAVTALFAAAAVALMAVQTCGAAPTDAQLVVEAVLGGGRTSASRFVLNAANGRIESDDSFGAQKPSTSVPLRLCELTNSPLFARRFLPFLCLLCRVWTVSRPCTSVCVCVCISIGR